MRKVNGKKGVTLIELTIVLALVTILSLCVVTLTVMVNDRAKKSSRKNAFLSDATVAERLLDYWLNEVGENGAGVTVGTADNGMPCLKTLNGYFVFANNGETNVLRCKLPSEEREVELSQITYVNFDIVEKEGDFLFYCALTYKFDLYDAEEQEKTHVFTVNPKAGEVIKGGE